MKKIKNKIVLSSIVLVSAVGSAQTVNSGELTISAGTIMSTVRELDNKASGELSNDGDFYVYSHFNNDGLVGFTPGSKTGTTRMYGKNGYQNVSGSVPMEWNHAEFNNANVQPAFHLSNEVRISGKAVFEKGIVDDDSYGGLVVFEETAEHAKVSNTSHVDGEVRKNGNTAFTFPVGDGGYYRHARISAPAKTFAGFTSKYFLENSDNLYPHSGKEDQIELIDDTEYWKLDKSAGDDNIFLTLSWNDKTTPSTIDIAPYDEIHIVRWDENQRKWIDEGGASNEGNKEVSMVLKPLSSYGIFTLARVKSAASSDLVIHNGVSPDDDGLNDFFRIDGLDKYKANRVEIYNRWGVKVFETSGYGTAGKTFKGFSEGRVTVDKRQKLPVGTYFYVIEADGGPGGKDIKKSGYLYINY